MTGASLFQIHSITERIREQQLPGDGIGCRCSNLERLGRMRRVGPLSIHWKCPVYIGLRRGTKGQMPLTLPCAPHSQAGSENGKRSGNCQRTEPFSFFLDGEVRVWRQAGTAVGSTRRPKNELTFSTLRASKFWPSRSRSFFIMLAAWVSIFLCSVRMNRRVSRLPVPTSTMLGHQHRRGQSSQYTPGSDRNERQTT